MDIAVGQQSAVDAALAPHVQKVQVNAASGQGLDQAQRNRARRLFAEQAGDMGLAVGLRYLLPFFVRALPGGQVGQDHGWTIYTV